MPKNAQPKWADLLREMRATGMTQTEIAQAVEMSQASVSDMLAGHVTTTSYERGLRIIAAHRVAMRRRAAKAIPGA